MEAVKLDLYSIVTEIILNHLEKGVVPWKEPLVNTGIPRNAVSGKRYTGINVWLLGLQGYERNLFLTFKQAQEIGAHIKKGEKGYMVVFWKWLKSEDSEEHPSSNTRGIPLLRYYTVFNIAQCTGVPARFNPIPTETPYPIQACEGIVSGMPNRPDIVYHEPEAFYNPKLDFVNMPTIGNFVSRERYYQTLFHELVHATGHETRLSREGVVGMPKFGSRDYSIEELIAEMGASYLCSYAGIAIAEHEQSAAYIANWLTVLRNDRRFVLLAAAKAQKAVDYILSQNPQ